VGKKTCGQIGCISEVASLRNGEPDPVMEMEIAT